MQFWQACVLGQIFGLGYAGVRFVLHRYWPDHGLTPMLVAVGVSVVVAIYAGWRGLEPAAELLTLFSLAGWPMVLEFYVHHVWDRRRQTPPATPQSETMELDF